ncbi:MAG: TRAP transporter small permease subunit [Betaproteobacteria bacterium]|nr:TRAP transporter small permease subunit [Betaproteobacteria bacterium]
MTDLPEIVESRSAIDGYGRPQPAGFHRLTDAMNAIGTVWILVLMVLINTDVIGRDVFGAPVRGVTEIVSMSIVGIVFIQLAGTLHAGKFTRAEVLLGYLQRRHRRLARALQGFYHLVGAALLAVICRASCGPLAEAIRIGEYVGAVGDFVAPMWPVRLIIVLGSACATLTFLFLALDDFKAAGARQ